MKYKISVIVPIYNAEKTIKRCICSLVHQSYDNLEIILVNDGSQDCSLSICQNFAEKDSRIIVIDKENGGVSSARNTGIDKASGDFLMFCDSDDWVKTDYCYDMLRCYSEGQLLMCEIEERTKHEESEVMQDVEEDVYVEEINKSKFLEYKSMGLGSPTNKLFKRNIVMDNKIKFSEELFLGEDLDFVLSYLKCIPGNIQYLHKKLYVYQVENDKSLSKKAPSCKQNELLYEILTDAIVSLKAENSEAYHLRNKIIMYDFEKTLIAVTYLELLTFREKCQEARKIMSTKAYQSCCRTGIGSSNFFYDWLYKSKKAVLLMAYLCCIKKRRSHNE